MQSEIIIHTCRCEFTISETLLNRFIHLLLHFLFDIQVIPMLRILKELLCSIISGTFRSKCHNEIIDENYIFCVDNAVIPFLKHSLEVKCSPFLIPNG